MINCIKGDEGVGKSSTLSNLVEKWNKEPGSDSGETLKKYQIRLKGRKFAKTPHVII